MIFLFILLAVVVIAAIWIVSAFNGLVSLKNQTLNGWK